MKITGENTIPMDQEAVWRGLNDPEALRQSIPGCESLEKTGDNAFKATVTTRIGPVTAKFEGDVELGDLDPPNGYTLRGSGSAGPMGNAKGAARVSLSAAEGGGTLLKYDVDAELTGKIAQLGSRLIQSTASLLAGQFFTRFASVIAGEAPSATGSGFAGKAIIMAVIVAVAVAGAIFALS
ncbi:MAG: carbon monoxide dehydrogenase subunit G [Pseudomonadota bacterium]